MKHLIWLSVLAALFSCSSLTGVPKSELQSGYYHYRKPDKVLERVYVDAKPDCVTVVNLEGTRIANHPDQKLYKRSFDADILVTPFKFRPIASQFPRQLTANFNGNVFLGYRIDRYRLRHFDTPLGTVKEYRQRAITVGGFGGIGAASITPWTTNYQTNDEYFGFIFSRGLSVMVGVNNLTVGLGIGWDYLTDRDKDIWIYQNKNWYGLTVSLHLN